MSKPITSYGTVVGVLEDTVVELTEEQLLEIRSIAIDNYLKSTDWDAPEKNHIAECWTKAVASKLGIKVRIVK